MANDKCELGDVSKSLMGHPENTFQSKKGPQYAAALTASIGAFGLGTALGWTSPALPSIEERGDFDNLKGDSELATWIGAMAPLGCFFAGFAAGFLVQRIGRKNTMLVLAPPFIAGWLVIAFAHTASLVLVGRFVTGFCGGAFTLICPIYVSETAEDSLRGLLSSTLALFIVSGILFTYIIGSFTSWSVLSIISAIIPAVLGIGMFFMPDTPRYLLMKGKDAEARKALKWLRGAQTDEQIEPEIKAIEASIEEGKDQSTTLKDLLAGPVLKPTAITMTLMFLQQFGGINAVVFYSVDIFKAAGTDLSENVCAITIATVMVVFAFVSTLLVERLGRKILLLVSELGMAVSLLVLGVYFYIKEHDPELASTLGWLPLTSLVVYIITYNLGIGPLPWTLAGELLPPHVKGITSSIATAFCWGQAFLITKFFKTLLTAITAAGCYWFFSGCCFFGFVFCLTLVPETKGKSLDEIQRLFKSK